MANLAGLEGFRLPSRTQSTAKTGANRMMKSGGSDWYQLAGKPWPRIELSVLRSAKRLSVEPACSKAIQNTDAASEEHGDHHQALPLLAGPLAAQEQPGEERHRDADQHPLEVPGDRLRIERHDARSAPAHAPATSSPTVTSPDQPHLAVHLARPRPGRSAGPGCRPSGDRCFPPSVYWTRPRNMPTAAAPKPQCQEVSGADARPTRGCA